MLRRGVIVRHLVLPGERRDSERLLRWLAQAVPVEDIFLSLMSQYTPYGEIERFKELQRRITAREYDRVLSAVKEHGLKNVFLQEHGSADERYIPDWDY